MSLKLLQANVNHARAAQDLLLHSAAERGCSMSIVSEPYWVPPRHPHWAAPGTGSGVDVAITWRRTADPLPCVFLEAGGGWVAVRWGDVVVVGVYLAPSLSRASVKTRLGEISGCVRKYAPAPAIVAGDFNAWNTLWSSRSTNRRGKDVETWAASLGLCLINRGARSTCVRPGGGESIVDLTWATPNAAARITGWRVLDEVHSESDHLYIEVVLDETPAQVLRRRQPRPRRWVLGKFEEDPFEETMLAGLWRI